MKDNCIMYIFIILLGIGFILYNHNTKMMEGFTLPRNRQPVQTGTCASRTSSSQCTNGYASDGLCKWNGKCYATGNENGTNPTGPIIIN